MRDPVYHFESGDDALVAYEEMKDLILSRLPRLFNVEPPTSLEFKAVELVRAESVSGALYEPGSDGAGVFYVNVHDLSTCPKWSVETTTLHEGVPGHHLQVSLAQQLADLPTFQRFGSYTAYDEGWALYCESLGHELELFVVSQRGRGGQRATRGLDTRQDPLQLFGRLHDEMLRALRLVVDVGIHAKGWTAERATELMLENTSMSERAVAAEVERYIALPGQALAYKIGELTIRTLRRDAEAALGAAFSLQDFHWACLSSGSVPLDVLRQKVEQWVDHVQHGPSPPSSPTLRLASPGKKRLGSCSQQQLKAETAPFVAPPAPRTPAVKQHEQCCCTFA